MHIAQFTNVYRPTVNGVVRSISVFRNALAEMGQNVFIFAQDAGDYEDQEPFIFRYPSVKLKLLRMSDYPATIPLSPFIDWVLPLLKLDVIHAHHPFLIGRAAAAKAEEMNLPLVFTFHTQYQTYTHYLPLTTETVQDFVKGGLEIWLSEFLQRCHHIIAPTESIRKIIEETWGIHEQVTVLPTGIDVKPYLEADRNIIRNQKGWGNDKVLISAGRLAKEKNWPTLLSACKKVMDVNQNFRVVILGEGPEADNLRKFVRDLGISSQVEFPGNVPFDQIPLYLKAADIFGFASVTETQGLVTMEAMAAGLPIVAVDADGTRDAVHDDVQGKLVPNESDALAQALLSILGNEGVYQRYKENSITRALEFDINNQVGKLLDVYKQAIQDNQHGQFVKVKKHKNLLEVFNEAISVKLPGISH